MRGMKDFKMVRHKCLEYTYMCTYAYIHSTYIFSLVNWIKIAMGRCKERNLNANLEIMWECGGWE